jgi:hypothetical protein
MLSPFEWFEFLRVGATASGDVDSFETFVNYDEKCTVWQDLFKAAAAIIEAAITRVEANRSRVRCFCS